MRAKKAMQFPQGFWAKRHFCGLCWACTKPRLVTQSKYPQAIESWRAGSSETRKDWLEEESISLASWPNSLGVLLVLHSSPRSPPHYSSFISRDLLGGKDFTRSPPPLSLSLLCPNAAECLPPPRTSPWRTLPATKGCSSCCSTGRAPSPTPGTSRCPASWTTPLTSYPSTPSSRCPPPSFLTLAAGGGGGLFGGGITFFCSFSHELSRRFIVAKYQFHCFSTVSVLPPMNSLLVLTTPPPIMRDLYDSHIQYDIRYTLYLYDSHWVSIIHLSPMHAIVYIFL